MMEGLIVDTIESMQDMGDLYTRRIEVEKRRSLELENKLKVRRRCASLSRLATQRR
jgi:hypothetical protein